MTQIDLYGTLLCEQTLEAELLLSASTGATDNYEQLKNRPLINGVVLSGDKSAEDLFLASADDLTAEKTARENADNELLRKIDNGIALTATVQGSSLAITDAADNSGLYSLNIKGNSSQNGTPTPENPADIVSVGDSGSLTVTTVGKNLLKNTATTQTVNGVTFTVNNDGTVIADGTATATIQFNLVYGGIWLHPATYTLNGSPTGASSTTYALRIYKDGLYLDDTGKGITFTVNEYERYLAVVIIRNGYTANNLVFKPMLRFADIEDDTFESYKDSTVTITSALPLCSVGDVCDELIFNADGKAKVIKRTKTIQSYSNEAVDGEYLSTTGALTAGAKIICLLEKPGEINLTAEETQALLGLETFESLTNVFNSDNAQMAARYWRNEDLGSLFTAISRNTNQRLTALENAIIGG